MTSAYRSLSREALLVWQIENLVGGFAVASIALGVFQGPWSQTGWRVWELPVLALLALVTMVEGLWVIPRRHRRYRYALLPDCIVVVRGMVVRRRVVFPLHQVLYVETRQGPVLRHHGLYQLRLGTIADPYPLGPLPQVVVEQFQAAVESRESC